MRTPDASFLAIDLQQREEWHFCQARWRPKNAKADWESVIENVNRLATAMRAAKQRVYWAMFAGSPHAAVLEYHDTDLSTLVDGAEYLSELCDPRPEDMAIVKNTKDVFLVDELLGHVGSSKTIFLAGVAASECVEQSVDGGRSRTRANIVVVEDAIADLHRHNTIGAIARLRERERVRLATTDECIQEVLQLRRTD